MVSTATPNETTGRVLASRTRWIPARPGISITMIIVAFLAIWELTTSVGWLDATFVSTPQAVAVAVVDLSRDPVARSALRQTGLSIVLAFVIGTSAGIVIGTILGRVRILRDAYMAPIVFLLSTPKSIFLPIFVLALGIGRGSSSAFGAFEAFFYVVVNVVGGVDLVEPRHLQVAQAYRAGRLATFAEVIFPAAMPGIFSALWFGIKHALLGTMIAELWASRGGLGSLIRLYSNELNTANVLALVLVVSLVAILCGAGWTKVESRLSRWRGRGIGATIGTGVPDR